jgi:hypothetical protein
MSAEIPFGFLCRLSRSLDDFCSFACFIPHCRCHGRAQINEYRQFCAAILSSATARAHVLRRLVSSASSSQTQTQTHAEASAALAAIVQRAACIYFMYVQPQRAVYEINIASPTLKKIRDALGYGLELGGDTKICIGFLSSACARFMVDQYHENSFLL